MRILLIFCCFLAQASAAKEISGTWRTAEGEDGGYLHVHIEACGDASCGVIVHAVDETGRSNPAYEYMKRQILFDMVEDGGVWRGRVWAPDSGQTFRAKMIPSGQTAKLSGCTLGGIICRSQLWTRVD